MRRLALFQEQTSQLPDKLDEVLLHPVVTRLLDILARRQSKVAKTAPEETNTNENKKKKNPSLDVVEQTFKQPLWTKNQS
jgi:hypothetical protein